MNVPVLESSSTKPPLPEKQLILNATLPLAGAVKNCSVSWLVEQCITFSPPLEPPDHEHRAEPNHGLDTWSQLRNVILTPQSRRGTAVAVFVGATAVGVLVGVLVGVNVV